jgi:hypothetical protein
MIGNIYQLVFKMVKHNSNMFKIDNNEITSENIKSLVIK